MKGISRIDSRSTHGWYARVYRPEPQSKLFSDRKWGSQEEALAAAKQWLVERTPGDLPELHPGYPYPYFRTIPVNNTSGRLGVTVTYARHGRGEKQGLEFLIFGVHHREDGVARTKSFYLSQAGSKEAAFLKACQFRKAYEASYGTCHIVSRKPVRRRYSGRKPSFQNNQYSMRYSDEFQEMLRMESPKVLVIPGSEKITRMLTREGFGSDQTYYWREDVMLMLYHHPGLSFHEGQFAITVWK